MSTVMVVFLRASCAEELEATLDTKIDIYDYILFLDNCSAVAVCVNSS